MIELRKKKKTGRKIKGKIVFSERKKRVKKILNKDKKNFQTNKKRGKGMIKKIHHRKQGWKWKKIMKKVV